jgi:toxin ParE1/3/4
MSARRLSLQPRARSDLRSILLYTQTHWGADQRRRYRELLAERMDRLTSFSEMGELRDDLFPGCRALSIEQHIAYYRVAETEIIVVRVLHHRQDAIGRVTS